jgi:hypothetical protein
MTRAMPSTPRASAPNWAGAPRSRWNRGWSAPCNGISTTKAGGAPCRRASGRGRAAGGQGMRLLVFGQTGQVATELARRLPAGVSADFLGRDRADLMDPAACAAAIAPMRPDAVINAAAWTAVDRAEAEEAAATRPSTAMPPAPWRGPAPRWGMPFLHISTDYVFDGAGTTPSPRPPRQHPWAPMAARNWRARRRCAPQAAPM